MQKLFDFTERTIQRKRFRRKPVVNAFKKYFNDHDYLFVVYQDGFIRSGSTYKIDPDGVVGKVHRDDIIIDDTSVHVNNIEYYESDVKDGIEESLTNGILKLVTGGVAKTNNQDEVIRYQVIALTFSTGVVNE